MWCRSDFNEWSEELLYLTESWIDSCSIMYMTWCNTANHCIALSDSWTVTLRLSQWEKQQVMTRKQLVEKYEKLICLKSTAALTLISQGSKYCQEKQVFPLRERRMCEHSHMYLAHEPVQLGLFLICLNWSLSEVSQLCSCSCGYDWMSLQKARGV